MTQAGRGGYVFQSRVGVLRLAAQSAQIVAAYFVFGLGIVVFRGLFEPIGGGFKIVFVLIKRRQFGLGGSVA